MTYPPIDLSSKSTSIPLSRPLFFFPYNDNYKQKHRNHDETPNSNDTKNIPVYQTTMKIITLHENQIKLITSHEKPKK